MKNLYLHTTLNPEPKTATNTEKVIDLYENATEDYHFWSHDFNMHFGYFIPFKTCVFTRDTMLNQMNAQVFKRLQLQNKKQHIIDLGCGMGASIRYGLKHFPKTAFTGITISEYQKEKGNELVTSNRGSILQGDYRKNPFRDNTFNGAIAIESLCHTGCSRKALSEAYRVLKPGSTFVIADAFTKKDKNDMNAIAKYTYNGLCKSWSLEELANIHTVLKDLKTIGFKEIEVKNIWYRVAPSVLHVPFTIAGFTLKKLIRKNSLKAESIENMKGSFYALLSALSLQSFGYYIITAKK